MSKHLIVVWPWKLLETESIRWKQDAWKQLDFFSAQTRKINDLYISITLLHRQGEQFTEYLPHAWHSRDVCMSVVAEWGIVGRPMCIGKKEK